ncbi:MAG: IS1595 family transposase [Ekhidna sp.]|nr:IS1595 family transposase [Ekhidna sp.]
MKKIQTLSVYDFMSRFPDEKAAIKFIENKRWEENIICPYCNSHEVVSRPARKGHRCKKCRKDFTVKTGTIFEHSNIKLHKWLYAMYLFVTNRKGISSLQLSKELGMTQKSAWFLLQRLRETGKQSKEMLDNFVEIDEAYIGGKEANKHANKKTPGSQGGANKDIVKGFRDKDGKVKAETIPNIQHLTLKEKINKNITKGAVICTDELKGYNNLSDDYTHLRVNHSAKEFVNGMATTNGIESFWALLKRGYYGTYHHFSTKHLNRYINEFTFRQNEGNCSIDTIDRMTALCKKSVGKSLKYKVLING